MPPLTLPVTTDPNQKTKSTEPSAATNPNEWARDGVPDKTCLPYWGPYRLKGCGGLFTSVYEAKLMNLGTTPDVGEVVQGPLGLDRDKRKTYDKPDRCDRRRQDGHLGPVDVFDPVQCPPR